MRVRMIADTLGRRSVASCRGYPMRHKSRSSLVALTLMLVLALIAPSNAFADITVFAQEWVVSSTNPGAENVWEVVWREGWGNDPVAKYTIDVPPPNPDQPALVGGYYYLNRPYSVPGTITAAYWPSCYNSVVANASKWDLAIDLYAEYLNPGPLHNMSWTPLAPPDPARPYEGPYHLFVQMFAKDTTHTPGPIPARGTIALGLDMTPPAQVTGLTPRPGIGDPPVNGWLKQSRVHLSWDNKVYDTLSGTGYFELFMDGKPYMKGTGEAATSRKVYDLREHYPGFGFDINTQRAVNIEDLPAGKHTIQVRAVDRATNEGALSAPITLQVDPDMPEIGVTWPKTNGQVIGTKPTFTASVKDLGGVKSVKFYVDGVLKYTDTTSPYAATVDMGSAANGSSHTLRVLATDMADRTNFAERKFVIDKSVPSLTSVSANYTTFYPRKRDGYKDNLNIKFRSSEAGTAKLTIKNSKGTVVRTITKTCATGSNTITWNGKYNNGSVKAGTFTWKLTYTDAAGNVGSASAKKITIKFFQLVKTSRNRLKVIER